MATRPKTYMTLSCLKEVGLEILTVKAINIEYNPSISEILLCALELAKQHGIKDNLGALRHGKQKQETENV